LTLPPCFRPFWIAGGGRDAPQGDLEQDIQRISKHIQRISKSFEEKRQNATVFKRFLKISESFEKEHLMTIENIFSI